RGNDERHHARHVPGIQLVAAPHTAWRDQPGRNNGASWPGLLFHVHWRFSSRCLGSNLVISLGGLAMRRLPAMRVLRSIWAIAAVAGLGFSGLVPSLGAQAQEVKSADTIVKGLAPVKTRGFDPQAPAREAAQKELNAKLRGFKTRQITVEERTDVAKLIEE